MRRPVVVGALVSLGFGLIMSAPTPRSDAQPEYVEPEPLLPLPQEPDPVPAELVISYEPPSTTTTTTTTTVTPPPTTSKPKPPPEPKAPPVAPEAVHAAIAQAAAEYGVDVNLMTRIIGCESGFNPNAKNRTSGALGLGQHLPRYWPGRAEALGLDPAAWNDPLTNARVTAWMLSTQGTKPWAASRHCWS